MITKELYEMENNWKLDMKFYNVKCYIKVPKNNGQRTIHFKGNPINTSGGIFTFSVSDLGEIFTIINMNELKEIIITERQ